MVKQGIRTQVIDKNGKQTTVIKKDPSAIRKTRTIPVAVINAAMKTGDVHERVTVASNVTDRRVLNRLARDSDEVVAQAAQSSGNLLGKDYDRLYDEKLIIDFAALASPTIVDMEINRLGSMVFSGLVSERLTAAKNYNMPEDVLSALKNKGTASISQAAEKFLERHYRRNHRQTLAETLYVRLDAAYDNNDGIWVAATYKEKIERLLGDIPKDAAFYEREDYLLDSSPKSERYDVINELIASTNMTGSTTVVDPKEFQKQVDKLTDDLFVAAGLAHEVPYRPSA